MFQSIELSFHYLPLVVNFICIRLFNSFPSKREKKPTQTPPPIEVKLKYLTRSIYILFRVISGAKKVNVSSRLSCTVIVLCDVAYFCWFSIFLRFFKYARKKPLFTLLLVDFVFFSFVLKSYSNTQKKNKSLTVFVLIFFFFFFVLLHTHYSYDHFLFLSWFSCLFVFLNFLFCFQFFFFLVVTC